MLPFLIFAVIWASGQAQSLSDRYTYSPAVGGGSGSSFSSETDGRITAIRVWAVANSHISGFQLRYDHTWSPVFGLGNTYTQEIELFDGETIVQVSGKYDPSNYIYQMVLVTSRGRFLTAGQPYQVSFNFYPTLPDAELMMLSGRFNGHGITSLGAHWGYAGIYPMTIVNKT